MNFYQNCEEFLQKLADEIEAKDINSSLEVEYNDGILEIEILALKKTFVINRNVGNQKIWYSSPLSGADYFSFDKKTSSWLNEQGVDLVSKLQKELVQKK